MGWVCTPFGDFETTPLALDAERQEVAGVFLFVRTEGDVDLVVYVGQTESLSDCASGAAWDQARSLGARSLHVVCIAEAHARERFRAWLVAQLRPPLNRESAVRTHCRASGGSALVPSRFPHRPDNRRSRTTVSVDRKREASRRFVHVFHGLVPAGRCGTPMRRWQRSVGAAVAPLRTFGRLGRGTAERSGRCTWGQRSKAVIVCGPFMIAKCFPQTVVALMAVALKLFRRPLTTSVTLTSVTSPI